MRKAESPDLDHPERQKSSKCPVFVGPRRWLAFRILWQTTVAKSLAKQNIFVAAYDQPGDGYSEPEPDAPSPAVKHVRSFDWFVEDVFEAIEWMKEEAGVEGDHVPVYLFGESFGGLVVRRQGPIIAFLSQLYVLLPHFLTVILLLHIRSSVLFWTRTNTSLALMESWYQAE
jgi:hypothetical protein